MAESVQFPQQRVRFGAYEVDLQARELWKAGRRRKLTGQPFSVLAILLERPGEVVSREELQKRLWPDTFVDVDHNLNTAINKIREALNDSKERPQFIETLSRRGYRFIAKVESVQSASPPVPDGVESASSDATENGAIATPMQEIAAGLPVTDAETAWVQTSHPPLPRKWRVAGWSALAIAALVIAYLLRPAMPAPQVTGTSQLTRDGVPKLYVLRGQPPALLTDGSRIYFTEPGPVRSTLMQISTDGGEAVPIHLPFDSFPYAASLVPDRPELLVTGGPSVSQGTALWRVPVPAGQPRRIGSVFANDATLSPDGTTLYYTFGRAIFRANPDGSDQRKILAVDGDPYWIRVSPDGKVLRFSVARGDFDTNSLWEAHPDGTHARQLLAGWNSWKNDCCGNWTSDGKYFLFESTRDGVANLWATRETGDLWRKTSREPVRLTLGEMSSQAPLPNREGTKVFFIGATSHGEVVRYDAKTQTFTPYLPGLSAEGLAFSQDGKKLAYVTYPEGILWVSAVDGSERRQLSFLPMQVALPRWSPDGTRIVFTSRTPGKPWQIYVVTAEGGNPEQLTSGDSDNMDAVWSADGNSLVFSGEPYRLRESKEPGIHILNLKTHQVTDMPGSERLFSPRSSPDGHTLLAMGVFFDKLELYDFAERKWQDLVKMPAVSYPGWSRDGKCIYFATAFNATMPVYQICLNDKKLERIVDLSKAGPLAEGSLGGWTGLAPDDSILATRDIGIQEIYALDTHFPK